MKGIRSIIIIKIGRTTARFTVLKEDESQVYIRDADTYYV